MSDGDLHIDDLARELGAAPPSSFATLKADEAKALSAALATAREHQNEALAEAIENGLGFVPRLMRGPVKRVLFG